MKPSVPTFQAWLASDLRNDQEGFLRLAALLKRMVGIHLPLNSKNQSLVASRLNPIFRKHRIESFDEYLRLLDQGDAAIIQEFISALTTNTTQFFREDAHFGELKKLLSEMILRKGPRPEIRVWCAASSTGQEPYSIAMTLLEAMGEGLSFHFKMLATDIDTQVLERAANGVYTEESLRSLPPAYLQKYFRPIADPSGTRYEVSRAIRAPITFACFNLLEETYPFQYPFDFIFCRNVLIYFDRATSASVIHKLIQSAGVGSYLFLGHAEAGMLRSEQVANVNHAVYRRKY